MTDEQAAEIERVDEQEVDPHEVDYDEDDDALPDPDRQRYARIGIVVAGVLALVLTGVFLIPHLFVGSGGRSSGPERVVSDYMTALKDGNARRALEIAPLKPAPGQPGRNPFVTDDVFGDATSRVSSFEVGDPSYGDGKRTMIVPVTYHLGGGGRHKATLTAERRSDGWVLQPVTWSAIEVPAGLGTGIRINGHRSGIDASTGTHSYSVLPGRYRVTATGVPAYMTAKSVRLSAGTVNFDQKLRSGLRDDIDVQLTQLLSRCIFASTELRNAGCSNWVSSSPTDPYDSVLWSLDVAPTYRIRLQPDGSVSVTTVEEGRLLIDYHHHRGAEVVAEQESLPASLAEHVRVRFDRKGAATVSLDDRRGANAPTGVSWF